MIITPRKYFSYSQMSSYKYSKQQFLKSYYYGEKQDSVFLDLGKRLGTALQFRKIKEIPEIEKIRKQIPLAKIYEHELKTIFKKIPLLCYLDGFFPEEFNMHEYKTGQKPSEITWKNQMLFYCVALYMMHKKLPNKITLYWCPTYFDENDQLRLTGEVKTYDIKITMQEVLMFAGEIIRVWEEIKELCLREYQMTGILPKQK